MWQKYYAVSHWVIYTSPLRRACETIKPLAKQLGLPVRMEPDLRERKLGNGVFDNFFKTVEVTWQNPLFVYPADESNLTDNNAELLS